MGAGRGLEETSSLSVFAVFVFFLVASQIIEKIFHCMHHKFEHWGQEGLLMALGKVKEELMLMGFVSLLLIAFEEDILQICVNMKNVGGVPLEHQSLCPNAYAKKMAKAAAASSSGCGGGGNYSRRMLLASTADRRDLAAADVNKCQDQFIEQAALHQTHIIIFYIAMMHIFLGILMMYTASKKVLGWAKWEHYGESDNEHASKLNIPPLREGWKAPFWGFVEQFTQSVDPAAYVAIRRFFICKNKIQGPPGEL